MGRRLALLAVVLIVLTACVAPRARHRPPDFGNPVYTVAVLPVYNATNDVNGPMMVREEFNKRIQDMHYSVMPLKDVDTILRDRMGITLGSQLDMTTPQQLGEVLGVDGVVFGYLLDFDDVTTGVYNVKKVRAGFKLVETASGRAMWTKGLGVKSILAGSDVGAGITLLKEAKGDGIEQFQTIQGLQEIEGLKEWHIIRAGGTEKVSQAAMLSIGEKLLTKALGVHLKLETEDMLKRIMPGFPIGPGSPRAELRKAPKEEKP